QNLAVPQFADRGNANVKDPVLSADILADAVHSLTRLTHAFGVADALRGPLCRLLHLCQQFGRDLRLPFGAHNGIFPERADQSSWECPLAEPSLRPRSADRGRSGGPLI